VLGGKWKPQIIMALANGKLRPSQLARLMPSAGIRVVNQQLRGLMEYGIVQRQSPTSNATPHSSYYMLTSIGRTLIPIIEQLERWGNDFRTDFNNRTEYI